MRLGASAYAYAVLFVLLALSLHGTLEVCRVRPSERMRAALPLPLHPPPQAARSAVLAISRGSDFYGVYRYVSSVRRHCPDTEIVIFTDAASLALNPALGPMLDMFGVTVVTVAEGSVPPEARSYHPSSQRWLAVRAWMRARAEAAAAGREPPIDTLMLSDARDMYFQGDPFALLEKREGGGRGFYAFVESHDTIGGSEWNYKWVADCFGSEGLAKIEMHPVSCSGTSMGSWDDVMAYVELMCACGRICVRSMRCCLHLRSLLHTLTPAPLPYPLPASIHFA
jgi:hypothetical protein